MQILIVEDNKYTAIYLKEIFENENFQIVLVENGNEAIHLLGKMVFNLILLDFNLPDITGLEILQTIRKSYHQIELPVIILSSITENDKIVNLLEEGANDFISKPFADINLKLKIRNLLQLQNIYTERLRAEKELEKYRNHLEELVEQRTKALNNEIEIRKATEKILINSESILKQAQSIAKLGSWELDIQNNRLSWSDEIFRIFDLEPQSFKATFNAFLENIHPDDRLLVNETYSNSLITKEPYDIIHRLLLKNGTIKYVNERCVTTFDKNGKPLISRGIVIDITEQILIENELRQARDQAQSANKAKTVFLSNMSHELRTPLTAILGFSNLVRQQENITALQKEQLTTVFQCGEHLLSLIDDILNMSSIDAQKLKLSLTKVDLSEIIITVYNINKVNAYNKELDYVLEKNVSLPHYVLADGHKLKQIMLNLITNAVKFTDKGKITIRSNYIDSNSLFVFEVEDTGCGIPEEMQKDIFKPFIQNAGKKLFVDGAGLGLSITVNLIEMMNGTISLQSEPKKGSIFRVEIPLERTNDTVKKGFNENSLEKPEDLIISGKMIFPEETIVLQIIESAEIGDYNTVNQIIEKLLNENSFYRNFYTQIKKYTKDYNKAGILNFLEKHIQDDNN